MTKTKKTSKRRKGQSASKARLCPKGWYWIAPVKGAQPMAFIMLEAYAEDFGHRYCPGEYEIGHNVELTGTPEGGGNR